MARQEVYCETCGSNQPMIQHEQQQDELNAYPWYDIVCGTCYSIIATIQIVPDDKPLESSKAVEYRPEPVNQSRRSVSTDGLDFAQRSSLP